MEWKKIAAGSALVILGIGIGYAIWGRSENKIITMPQQAAETDEGVKQAADAAGVPIDKGQAEEAAEEIKTAEKEYTVSTTVGEVPETAEEERKKAEADFSILTDPNNPDKPFDMSEHDSSTPVELNQYNIRAYKKSLRGVTFYPSSATDWKPAMISVDYSKKISKSGRYLGVSAAYNWDSEKAYVGVRYEF